MFSDDLSDTNGKQPPGPPCCPPPSLSDDSDDEGAPEIKEERESNDEAESEDEEDTEDKSKAGEVEDVLSGAMKDETLTSSDPVTSSTANYPSTSPPQPGRINCIFWGRDITKRFLICFSNNFLTLFIGNAPPRPMFVPSQVQVGGFRNVPPPRMLAQRFRTPRPGFEICCSISIWKQNGIKYLHFRPK